MTKNNVKNKYNLFGRYTVIGSAVETNNNSDTYRCFIKL